MRICEVRKDEDNEGWTHAMSKNKKEEMNRNSRSIIDIVGLDRWWGTKGKEIDLGLKKILFD